MKSFFKIGLPWAVSLGLAFYLGIETGKNEQPYDPKSHNNFEENQNTPKPDLPPSRISSKESTDDRESSLRGSLQTSSPPLPPNLIRIMKGSGILERMGSYLDALRSMDKSNVQDVVGAFEALPAGYGRHLEMKLLMRSWSAIDPEAALRYASEKLDEKSEKRFGISEALAGWATQDPEAALAWAESSNVSQSPENNPYIVGVIKGVAEKDLQEADRLLWNLPPGNAKWQSSTFLAQEYSKKSAQEAIAWANQFPDDDPRLRETILGQVASRIARKDIEGTAQWVDSMPSDAASQRVMDNLLTQWVSQSPEDASNWVSEINEQEKQSYAMKQLTSRWSLVDPVSTAKWLNSFPPSSTLDPVVGEFVNRISGRDPEGAAGWALSITEPDARKRAIKKVLQSWEKMDPEGSRAWLQQNQINPE